MRVVYCLDCDKRQDQHANADHPFNPCKGCESGDLSPHLASRRCESGGYDHCSCDVCF